MSKEYVDYAIKFLSATFPFAPEFQHFWMSIQGAMAVRGGPNKDGKMNWFHAFAQGLVISYAGGLLTPFWMGKPSAMLANDLCFAFCLIAFVLVNYSPGDLGYKVLQLFPLKLLTVMGAQLFRAMGIISFVNIAYQTFKDSPSKYYPTPIFGPILNGTILGNMGFFFWKGFHGHLEGKGMPFPFQNGFFVSSIYHLVTNDKGPVGDLIRGLILKLPYVESDNIVLYTTCLLSLFMQVNGILQMPEIFGPSFNPFNLIQNLIQVPNKFVLKTITKTENQPPKKSSKKKKKA